IDLARGQMMYGDRTAALDALHAARRAAPQKTRHDPMVRETLDVLARARRVPDELREFATWVGLPLHSSFAVMRPGLPRPGGWCGFLLGWAGRGELAGVNRVSSMITSTVASAATSNRTTSAASSVLSCWVDQRATEKNLCVRSCDHTLDRPAPTSI